MFTSYIGETTVVKKKLVHKNSKQKINKIKDAAAKAMLPSGSIVPEIDDGFEII